MQQSFASIFIHVIDTFTGMVWQIYWPLAFGLMLSSVLRNILPVDKVATHLGHTNIKSLALTTGLGMVSSSCSYAAASLAKTLLIKHASLANAMAFLVASTNLILEMFIVLVSLLGWQFLWGEIIGGLILIIFVAIAFSFYPQAQLKNLEAKLGNSGTGDNSDTSDNSGASAAQIPHHIALSAKIKRSAGFFHMDINMIGKEIMIGVVISSLLIALIPADWWRDIFINNQTSLSPWLHSLLDVVIGIFVAVIAYVCSVGNLLLAAALWHGGISFGGVMGFILADVLTIPMTRVYKKYYGAGPARWIVGLLFISILATGLLLDVLFSEVDWSASKDGLRNLHQSGFGFNFTTVMNLIFMPLSVWYFRVGKKANAGMRMG